MILKKHEIKNWWKEYFHELLNVRYVTHSEATEVSEEEMEVDITMAEVEETTKMKMEKAVGIDKVAVGTIKAAAHSLLTSIGLPGCSRVCEEQNKFQRIGRKGLYQHPRKETGRYVGIRVITIISHVAKVMKRVLENRIWRKVENQM